MKIINKKIYISKIPIEKLTKKYGTPIFVYDEKKVRDNFRRVAKAFQKYYPKFKLYYAIKVNSNPAIAKILINEGAGVDAASINEILLAQKLGLKKEKIIFSGNYLSDDDLKAAIKSQAIINLDDISLFSKLLKFGQPELISFRINPGIGKSNVGEGATTAGPKAKFGIPHEKALNAYKEAKNAGIKNFGAHMMTGSCVLEPKYFQKITAKLMDIIGEISQKLKIDFQFIDLGGSLGIPYKEDEKELNIDKTIKLISKTIKEKAKYYKISEPLVCMEPGRYFVGNSGYLIGKVHAIKHSYNTFYGTDINMNIVPRQILYKAFHKIYVDNKINQKKFDTLLTGQICEQTDVWSKDQKLPKLDLNDLILIENCGAYCFGMSYKYNGRLLPAEILVNKEKSYIIREAEKFEDMIKNTKIPQHLTSLK
ncbi:MAG: Diaminopimelate decarboxylase [Candidatus Peregrinibacteria bacterium GW2011_GWA2_33_10]|nr:MAG: Diaminopimelate decarboxylase [Candidatus Peregrinibacteria bacterium GW2011_GWA2_33_10]KKP40835.1 MAG: hypothetical protein UR30_C0003G0007 [Candidatus Peregrinibacteria bacterium GW2011_GWC2_33_13]OGJ46788.1 MAG: diaminopimelate decarboxylase [Candidatus Peregrinibacteria bacterium RIFOXYA2_FULL_33_7]